jgi:hypothetical protein
VIVNDDVEIWLLFAPFWILGIAALIGGLWHMGHAWAVTRRAQLAGHGLSDRRRHHLKRALIGFGAFFALSLLGIGVAAAVGLLTGG